MKIDREALMLGRTCVEQANLDYDRHVGRLLSIYKKTALIPQVNKITLSLRAKKMEIKKINENKLTQKNRDIGRRLLRVANRDPIYKPYDQSTQLADRMKTISKINRVEGLYDRKREELDRIQRQNKLMEKKIISP